MERKEIMPAEALVASSTFLLATILLIRWIDKIEKEFEAKRKILIFQESHVPKESYELLMSITEPLRVRAGNK